MKMTKITKREARKRYDAGQPIAYAGEPWWFDNAEADHTYVTLVSPASTGLDFDTLTAQAQDNRYKSNRVSYAKPTEGA